MSPVQKNAVREIQRLAQKAHDTSAGPMSTEQREEVHTALNVIVYHVAVILHNEEGR